MRGVDLCLHADATTIANGTTTLFAALNRCLAEHNRDPQPLVRPKRADQILAEVNGLNASVRWAKT
jgi:hypothetical protein